MAEAPHATSDGPAVSLDDAGMRLKADQHVEKADEKQTKGVKRHRLGDGGEQRKKKQRQQRKHSYHILDDGQPQEMSQIHVNFARLSAAYITSNPLTAQQKILVLNFNSSSHATQKYARVATGIQGSGKADNFFNNRYIKMEDLKKIASEMNLMPIPLLIDQDGREYSRYEADGDAGDDTAAVAGGGGSGDTTAVGGGGRDARDEGGTDAAGGAAAAAGRDGQDCRSRRGHPACAAAEAAAHGGAAETAVQTPKKAAGVAGGQKRRPKGSRSNFSPSDSSPSEGTANSSSSGDDVRGGDSAAAPGSPAAAAAAGGSPDAAAAAAAAGRRRVRSITAAAPAGVPSDGRRPRRGRAAGVPSDGRAGAAAALQCCGAAPIVCPPRAVRQRKKWKKRQGSGKLWMEIHNLLIG